jgi:4-amino-4-deoxy-L-arabinose transferase-like glycosyltransferase
MLAAGMAAILCLAYVLFIHNLGATSLWDPDEPRQAIMAREMMERSDYVHPYLNGAPYLEKPPLYPWLIIIAAVVHGGLSEFAARIPSALAATALLVIVFLMGRRLAGQNAGLFSAFILAANFQFLGNARESVMDMTFAFFIGLTIFLAELALCREKRWLFACAFLPSACAILSKGPAGLVIPAGVLLVFLFSQGKVKRFFVPFLAGCALSLCTASVWFAAAGKAYVDEFVFHQNLVRYTKGFDHIESLFYYFPKLFFNFFPWSCLLPFAVCHAWKRKLRLPIAWFAFAFLFFEFSRSKRAIYLLPAYPAMALLVGIYVKEKWQTLLSRGWSNLLMRAFGLLLALLPLAGGVALSGLRDQREMLGGSLQMSIALGALAFLGLVFLFTAAKKTPHGSLAALFAYLICVGFLYHTLYMPALDRYQKSARLITDEVKKIDGGKKVYICGFNSPALIYYLGRPVTVVQQPEDARTKNRDDVILIVENRRDASQQVVPHSSIARQVRYEKDFYTILVTR